MIEHDISGDQFVNGVTTFSTEAFLEAVSTIGSNLELVREIQMHIVIFQRIVDHNLVGMGPVKTDPTEGGRVNITFMGIPVKITECRRKAGVFETLIVPKDNATDTVCLLTREY